MLFFAILCCLTLTSKTTSLKNVDDKVRRAKWPHGTSGNFMCLSTSGLFNWICYQHLKFYPPHPPLAFRWLFHFFDRRYVSFMCNIFDVSNKLFLVCTTHLRYPISLQYIQYISKTKNSPKYLDNILWNICRKHNKCSQAQNTNQLNYQNT